MTIITLSQCLDFTGLAPNEIILGASLASRHRALLLSYLLNLDRGAIAVREMIVADLRSFLDLGARSRAADALLVLRLFLFDHPHAFFAGPVCEETKDVAPASSVEREDQRPANPHENLKVFDVSLDEEFVNKLAIRIRKLRWIGIAEEAEQLEKLLRGLRLANVLL